MGGIRFLSHAKISARSETVPSQSAGAVPRNRGAGESGRTVVLKFLDPVREACLEPVSELRLKQTSTEKVDSTGIRPEVDTFEPELGQVGNTLFAPVVSGNSDKRGEGGGGGEQSGRRAPEDNRRTGLCCQRCRGPKTRGSRLRDRIAAKVDHVSRDSFVQTSCPYQGKRDPRPLDRCKAGGGKGASPRRARRRSAHGVLLVPDLVCHR